MNTFSTLIKEDIGLIHHAHMLFIDAENTVNHLARMVTNFIINKGKNRERSMDNIW